MESIQITSITITDLEVFFKQWIREVLQENGTKQDTSKPMNAQQAAEYLGMAVGTLYKKTSSQQITHIKRGKVLLFYRKDLDIWLESGKKEPVKSSIEENVNRSFIRQIRGKV